jgi:streptomycin 6-kinase
MVLKLPVAGGDEADAWRVLQHQRGQGAVCLIDHAGDGAVLLERALPGDRLTDLMLAGHDDAAMVILCQVAATLHHAAPPPHHFPRVEDWACGFARHRTSGDATIPAAMLDRAQALFAALAATQGARRLLHGDLHHDNILFDARRGWLAIDPKGVLGEAANEIGAALRNPTEDASRFADAAIIERRVAIAVAQLGLDRQRVLAWAFAQAVLSAVWSLEDGFSPVGGLATATALLPLI